MPVLAKRFIYWAGASLAVAFLMLLAEPMWAQQYTDTVLYNFCPQSGCPDGSNPQKSPVVFDSHGNLYGATIGGGANNQGTVYELISNGGTWTENVLYSFCPQSGCPDGKAPVGGAIFDSQGNLYGITSVGGANNSGAVYELSPPSGGNGPWTETVLYSLCSLPQCEDGGQPNPGLAIDSHGNLYGTTQTGGSHGSEGVAFELSPNGNGSWTYTVIFNFCIQSSCNDGGQPSGRLIFDSSGNLYGVAQTAGANNSGVAFELSPGSGSWTETVLYAFCPVSGCSDGSYPVNGLVFDPQGNLYGTAIGGGTYDYGVVFELSPAAGGSWTERVLAPFCPGPTCTNGYSPEAPLTSDSHGNVFGTTVFGGVENDGVAFELTPSGGGQFTYNIIYAFCSSGNCLGGNSPQSSLLLDSHGNLYGTAETGAHDEGVVYELSPVPLIPTSTVLMTAPNPSNVGQQVTMTATVMAQNGSLPTGTVVFESNGVQIGSASLNNSGVAVLNYSALNAGTDSITAMYQGSSTLAPSTSNTVQQVVRPVGSTTSVTSSPNPSTFGQSVTITATVGPSGPPLPTGTVGFSSNGTGISGCTAVPLSSSLTAVCMTSSLAVGTDSIVATYSGDSNYHGSSGTFSQIVNPVPSPVQFVPLTPCRVVDTRNGNGTFGGPAITGNSSRSFPLSLSGNPCNIPSIAIAYSLNVTVVPQHTLGYLTIWPTGEGQPTVSTLNSPDGRIKANAAIVPAGTPSGSVSVYVTDTTNVILDIDGYFAAPTSGSLQFYPLTPCRIIDTRNGDGGALQAGVERDYTIAGQCGIPSDAAAYSFNVTVLPAAGGLDYLTVWPKGESRPTVSTLNDNTGTVVANAAIVPAGSENATAFYAHSNATNLLLDVDGYFAAPGTGGLSLYPLTPCRVLDTRHVGKGQPFMGDWNPPNGIDVLTSQCAPPSSAKGFVFNATVVPSGSMPYLTLWPHGENQPTVSTLNAYDGFITSNMAIVPTNDGSIDAYAAALTQLILDISGYFAP